MIIELELGAILASNVLALALIVGRSLSDADRELVENTPVTPAAAPAAAAPAAVTPRMALFPMLPHVEIVKRAGNAWVHVGHRHAEHADIREALKTEGLGVRHADGRIEEGRTCH